MGIPPLQIKPKNRSPLLLPLVFFLLSIGVIYSLWNSVHQARLDNLENETAVTAEQIKLRLEAWVDSRTAVLRYLGSSWEGSDSLDKVEFEKEAREITKFFPGFQAINLIDPDWVVRLVVPRKSNQAVLNKDLHQHPDPGVGLAIQKALATNTMVRSPLIHLLQGRPGFATYFPINGKDGSLLGIINGVFIMDNLVDGCLSEKRLKDRFSLTISTLSGQIAYAHQPPDFHDHKPSITRTLDIRLVGKNWQLNLVPVGAIAKPLLMTGEGLLTLGGLVLALALSLLLYAYLLRLSELQESRENYKLLVDNQADMLLKLDTEYRVTFASPSTLRTVQLSEEEFLGHPVTEFIHPDDRSLLVDHIAALRQGEERGPLEGRMQTPHGWIWTSWTGSDLRDGQGNLTGRISIGRDITKQREMEIQLRQGQKLQAVGQLAGGVAHDFNNIIQAVLGYLSFVKEDLPPDHPSREDVIQAELAAERAATLTRQLLAFSRRQMLQPTLLNLNLVTAELLPMLQRLLGESIALDFMPAENLPRVRADRGQLEQILVNLCVNARDAMPDGIGTITIRTVTRILDEKFCRKNRWAEPGNWVQLDLVDSGSGMDEEVLANIFEPFFTTKEVGKGTGLGLATVYGIIKQHGGLITVTSNPGRGTCFSLFFKIATGDAETSEPASPPLVTTGKETILLAEDEEMVRSLTRRVLEEAGYQVLTAANGRLAHKLWVQQESKIHLVILDMVMPEMGGRELAELILGEQPDTRILFISGYDSDAHQVPAGIPGLENLLTKPFSREVLLARVRETLDS